MATTNDIDFRAGKVNLYAPPGDDITFTVLVHGMGYETLPTVEAAVGTEDAVVDPILDVDTDVLSVRVMLSSTQTTALGTRPAPWTLAIESPSGRKTMLGGSYIGSTTQPSSNRSVVTVAAADGAINVTVLGGGGGSLSAAGILAALLGVDGAGSGLDADLLDGQSSAFYATAAALAAEATARADADTSLDGRLDTLEADPTTGAAVAAVQADLDAHEADTTGVHGIADTSQLATNASVTAAINALIDAAPGALDTLNELAAALGDDPDFAATVTTALAGKQPLDGDLTAIAALTTTPFGRALLALADQAAGRTALGLGSIATQAASNVAITGGTVAGITDLSIADGGTGASTASQARTNLGLSSMATQAASAVNIIGGSVTGITDLAVADGGTGASDAATARTNLGVPRRVWVDVRDHGAVGDGTTDDTVAIQAAITAAGASGTVFIPALSFRITSTLILGDGTDLRGVGQKGSILITSLDICMVRAVGGQGQAVRSLKLWNTATGARTTYDIEVVNPTKPVIENVEIDLPNTSTTAGGVRFYYDAGQAGSNSFMPTIDRLWVRNGVVRIDGVTDGKMSDSYVWSQGTGAVGSVQLVNGSNSWTFTNVDVVPPMVNGGGYYINGSNLIRVQGGLVDGSYTGIMTGFGVSAVNCNRLSITSTFWNLGRGGITFDNVKLSTVTGCTFSQCNKEDNYFADITLTDSTYNAFVGNTHHAPNARTNKAPIYAEYGTSGYNTVDLCTMEPSSHNYHATTFIRMPTTVFGAGNRPISIWPLDGSTIIVPPASMLANVAAAAWSAADMAYFARFDVPRATRMRYVNFKLDTSAGNYQVSLLRMTDPTGYSHAYTQVATTGVVATPTAADLTVDLGTQTLEPGTYAVAVWFSTTSVQCRMAGYTALTGARVTSVATGLTSGIPSTGTINWGSTQFIAGLTVSR